MKNLSLAMIVIVLVVGCATSGRVQVLGPDTFFLSATTSQGSGRAGAKKSAVDEATRYCTEQHKEVLVTSSAPKLSGHGYAVDITFRCLPEGHPALKKQQKKRNSEPGAV